MRLFSSSVANGYGQEKSAATLDLHFARPPTTAMILAAVFRSQGGHLEGQCFTFNAGQSFSSASMMFKLGRAARRL
jgi:hypothetical protein